MEEELNSLIDDFIYNYEEYELEGYSKKEIRKCKKILKKYIDQLQALEAPDDKKIMEYVKEVIIALNDLNDSCDGAFIETMEREMLADFIQSCAVEAGLEEYEDDITLEYREW